MTVNTSKSEAIVLGEILLDSRAEAVTTRLTGRCSVGWTSWCSVSSIAGSVPDCCG